MSDEDTSISLSRRRLVAGGLAASGVALAGCTGVSKQERSTNQANQNATKATELQRPEKPLGVQTESEYQQFVIDSLAYQNQLLELQAQALQNYMDAESADVNNES